MSTSQNITATIDSSFLITAKTENKIIKILQQGSPEDIEDVRKILADVERKQINIVADLIKKDPNFPRNLKVYIQKQIKKGFKLQENTEKKTEKNLQKTLLDKLQNS